MRIGFFNKLFLISTFSALFSMFSPAMAEYPERSVEIVVPVTPGSATDLLARILAQHLKERLDQSFVVSNKPGAASQIGASFVQRADPDGYTLLVIHSGIMANPFVYKSFPLDLKTDFTYVAGISQTPWVLAVNDQIPVNSVSDLIAYARDNPGKVNIGTTGGSSEIDMRNFIASAGLDAEVLLYPGGSQVMLALAKNEIQFALNAVRGIESLKGKGVKGIAITAAKPSALAPDLPTVSDSGVPGFEASSLWFGVLGPANLPQEITERINKEVNAVMQLPEVQEQLSQMAHETMIGTPGEFHDFAMGQLEYFETAARETGIKPN